MKEASIMRLILHMLEYAHDRMSNAGCNDFPEFAELMPNYAERETFVTWLHELNYANTEDKTEMAEELEWDRRQDFKSVMDWQVCDGLEEWVKGRIEALEAA